MYLFSPYLLSLKVRENEMETPSREEKIVNLLIRVVFQSKLNFRTAPDQRRVKLKPSNLTRVRASTIHVRERLKPLPTPLEVEGNDRDHLTGATVNIKVSARPSKKKAIPQSAQNWCTFNSISSNSRSPPGCTLMERGVVSAQGVLCEGGDVPIFDLAYVFSSYFVFDVFPRLR